jgi:hypothetical protein
MKNGISILIGAVLALCFITCKKETVYDNTDVVEVYEKIRTDRPDIEISKSQIVNAMAATSSTPCIWDFNYDGVVSSTDLAEFLALYGVKYNASDLTSFLAAFGETYIVDVIPAWNNFVQDNTPQVTSFSKVLCNGEVIIGPVTALPSIEFDETNWYYQDSLIAVGDTLRIQTYGQDGSITNVGWQGPCDGTKPITLEVIHNGYVFSRTVNSRISTANYPDTIPTCDELLGLGIFDVFTANSSYVGIPLTPYQFCTNCN